jgi:class 3 adenylate cyclase
VARPSRPPDAPGGAERKLVTVLLIEIDEAREGFADPDPEDAWRLLSGPLARVRAEVEAHGGIVEETMGGRTVALFGIPRTRDDDPERAVRAALAIRDALGGLRVQAAVATGEALVRMAPGPGRRRVAGEPVGAAARLQELSPTGTVLVSEATRRATERAIAYGPARQAATRIGEPLCGWPALAPRAGPASPSRRFPPLMGRERELAALLAAATRACQGAGPELVTIVGAAGIGKSRLLAELADRLTASPPEGAPVAWRQGRALPYGDGPTFGALAEAVKAEAGILESDGAELAGRRLAAAAGAVAEPVTAAWVAGHLRRLVGVGGGRAGAAGPTTAADREEEFAAWRRFLHGLAATRPLVLALEDLHRADDALLDFVESLADRDAGPSAILVLSTARPELAERRPGWGAGGTTVELEPLGDHDTTGLLATLLGHHGLPTEVDPALLGRVEGNPLFAEEYVRMLRDRGDPGANDPLPLPTGVHAIVAARLDALDPADKAVLHDAAVLGQVGWLGALAAICGRGRAELEASLDRLEAREFLQRAPASRVAGEAEYAFRHTLVRDVAYGQVLRAERAERHRRAASWLEALAPDRAEGRAELLAYHYRAALSFARAAGTEPPGLAARALGALRDAGDRAAALGGWEAAARFHAEALALCPEGDPARGRLLLRLGRARCRGEMAGREELTAAGRALLAAGEPVAAAEAEMLLGELAFLQGRGQDREAHTDRALELVAGAPPSVSKAAVLRGAMMHLVVASRHAEGLAVGREVCPTWRPMPSAPSARPGSRPATRAGWTTWRRPSPASRSWARPAGPCGTSTSAGQRRPWATCHGASPPWPPGPGRPSGSGRGAGGARWSSSGSPSSTGPGAGRRSRPSSTTCWPATSATTWSGSAGCCGAGCGWPVGASVRPSATPRRPMPWPCGPATPRPSSRPGPSWPGCCWPPAAGRRRPGWPSSCWPGWAAGCSCPTWVPTWAWSWPSWASRPRPWTAWTSRPRRGWRPPGLWPPATRWPRPPSTPASAPSPTRPTPAWPPPASSDSAAPRRRPRSSAGPPAPS